MNTENLLKLVQLLVASAPQLTLLLLAFSIAVISLTMYRSL